MRDEGEMMSAESGKRFKPYPAYKDSGVEWLGEIPAHWQLKPLKCLLKAPLVYGCLSLTNTSGKTVFR